MTLAVYGYFLSKNGRTWFLDKSRYILGIFDEESNQKKGIYFFIITKAERSSVLVNWKNVAEAFSFTQQKSPNFIFLFSYWLWTLYKHLLNPHF